MDRRSFLQKVTVTGLGITAGSTVFGSLCDLPVLHASIRKTANGIREIPLRLEDTPELAKVGSSYRLEVFDLEKDILVARVSEENFVAVDIKCTHKGCNVSYKPGSSAAPLTEDEKAEQESEDKPFGSKVKDTEPMFACPCHGSKFGLDGQPMGGPAKQPLGMYETSFASGEVVIKIPDGE